jgi:hypothetical protein
MLKKIVQLIAIACCFMSFGACSFFGFVTWREEVKLNDGRIIVVEQKKHADHGIGRETWLTINLPEFSPQPIVWHENLSPLVINIDGGKLYVVGLPSTPVEFKQYGSPRPAYVGFVWETGTWHRIPFEKIPSLIYTTNMLLEDFPPKGTILLTVKKKNSYEINGKAARLDYLRRLNSKFTFD